jgi:UDP-2,3-diacylglucosamine pyrophosphatase LpxH
MDQPEAAVPAPPAAPVHGWLDWMATNVGLAEIVLVFLLTSMIYVVWKAQQREDFDFAKMLKDETGKESVLNFGIMISLATSTWVVMHDTLSGNLSDNQWYAYLVTWSAARIFIVAAGKWDGRLPWAKKDA